MTSKLLGVPDTISSVGTIPPWEPLGVVGVWSPSLEFVDYTWVQFYDFFPNNDQSLIRYIIYLAANTK